jgi:hypothetical protein
VRATSLHAPRRGLTTGETNVVHRGGAERRKR